MKRSLFILTLVVVLILGLVPASAGTNGNGAVKTLLNARLDGDPDSSAGSGEGAGFAIFNSTCFEQEAQTAGNYLIANVQLKSGEPRMLYDVYVKIKADDSSAPEVNKVGTLTSNIQGNGGVYAVLDLQTFGDLDTILVQAVVKPANATEIIGYATAFENVAIKSGPGCADPAPETLPKAAKTDLNERLSGDPATDAGSGEWAGFSVFKGICLDQEGGTSMESLTANIRLKNGTPGEVYDVYVKIREAASQQAEVNLVGQIKANKFGKAGSNTKLDLSAYQGLESVQIQAVVKPMSVSSIVGYATAFETIAVPICSE